MARASPRPALPSSSSSLTAGPNPGRRPGRDRPASRLRLRRDGRLGGRRRRPVDAGRPIKAGDDIPTERLHPARPGPSRPGAPMPPGAARVIRSERGERREVARCTEVRTRIAAGTSGRRARRPLPARCCSGRAPADPAAHRPRRGGRLRRALVIVPPAVHLLVLGDEVVARGTPDPGRVRDVFTPSMPAVLGALGTRVARSRSATRSTTRRRVRAMRREPLLVTTGGSARGSADHVRASLRRSAREVLLDGIGMRPGHPLDAGAAGRARWCSASRQPARGYVGLVAIGRRALDGMLGRSLAPLAGRRSPKLCPAARSTRLVAVGPDRLRRAADAASGLGDAARARRRRPARRHSARRRGAGESVEYLPLPLVGR